MCQAVFTASRVQFPGLGLEFDINRKAMNIFGVDIFWYGIIIAFAFFLAVLLAMKDSRKYDLNSETILDLVLFIAPASVIAARVYYVIFDWQNFKDNPLDIFNTRKGGLAIYGAIFGGIAVTYIFARVRKMGVWKLFDFCVPYLPLAQAIGRWGNFFNQEAFGTNTDLPWGMRSNETIAYLSNVDMEKQHIKSIDINAPVHPTFLYESLWNLGVFLILIWMRKRKKFEGEIFFLYMALYGVGRAWVEPMRTDSLWLGNVRISQLFAVLFAVVFIILILVKRMKQKKLGAVMCEVGTSEYSGILKKLEAENQKEQAVKEIKTLHDGQGIEPVQGEDQKEEQLDEEGTP